MALDSFNNDPSLNKANEILAAQGKATVKPITPATVVAGGAPPTTTGATTTNTTTNELSELVTITGSKETRFDKSTLTLITFPKDVGTPGVPYVLFKIFEVETGAVAAEDATGQSLQQGANEFANYASTFTSNPAAAGAAGAVVGGLGGALTGAALASETGQTALNNAGQLIFGDAAAANGASSITNRAKNLLKGFALKRNIVQQKVAIGMFMPEGINTSYDHEYEALSVTSTLGLGGYAAQALSSKGKLDEVDPYITEAAATAASRLLGGDANLTKLGIFGATGRVVNPQLEMIYTSPTLRRFVFDFRMVPRNPTEAADIKTIIYLLKKYSAPTIPDNSTGRYFIPPAQFEIEFYDGEDNLNTNLFRTKKCVLSSVNIDYAPNGFATFYDGAPVETRMQLTFQETAIIDRTAIEDGY
jgi:hypothetical protein